MVVDDSLRSTDADRVKQKYSWDRSTVYQTGKHTVARETLKEVFYFRMMLNAKTVYH